MRILEYDEHHVKYFYGEESVPLAGRRKRSFMSICLLSRFEHLTSAADYLIFPLFWKYEDIIRCRFVGCPGAGDAAEYFSPASQACTDWTSRRDNRTSSSAARSYTFVSP
jgi:hypothetical protein